MLKIPPFEDHVVIYHSAEDGCWIAHSLKMDQIGTGERIVDALADFIRCANALLKLADSDESIAYLREAPDAIKELARNSKVLPREIYEVAHKHATGEWPKDWSLPEPKNQKKTRFSRPRSKRTVPFRSRADSWASRG